MLTDQNSVRGFEVQVAVGKGFTIYGQGDASPDAQPRLNLTDSEKFVSFLKSLTPEIVEERKLKDALVGVITALNRQVHDTYNFQEVSDAELNLIVSGREILAQYQELQIEAPALEVLKTTLEYASKRCLVEYQLVNNQGLLSPPGQYFGPADWQTDSTVDRLNERWKNALNTLGLVSANSHAHELASTLSAHLKVCVRHAIESLPTLTYWSPQIRASFETILKSAETRLQEFSKPES